MILKDRIALVTGAAGGIGQAICTALAAEGATIAVHYHKQEAAALDLVGELGGAATAFQADITAADQAQSLVDRVVERMGGIDILINNAGITIGGQSVVDMPLEDWHKVVDVNLHSVLYMSKAALPYMRKRQDGAVVNIASNVVNTLPGGAAAYATTKAGVVALTKVLSKEEAQHGIRVNAISPGIIHAGMGVGALNRRTPEVREQFLNTIPMRRSGGTEEVAAAVVFLVSSSASYVTGQHMSVNGGDRTESYQ
jgi:3-oxoacyl-[acyl-carrier protein] reductase